MLENEQFSCTACGRPIAIGDPFIASATYPARSFNQAEDVSLKYLAQNGEVLCASCAVDRLGASALSKLKGTVFPALAAAKKYSAKE